MSLLKEKSVNKLVKSRLLENHFDSHEVNGFSKKIEHFLHSNIHNAEEIKIKNTDSGFNIQIHFPRKITKFKEDSLIELGITFLGKEGLFPVRIYRLKDWIPVGDIHNGVATHVTLKWPFKYGLEMNDEKVFFNNLKKLVERISLMWDKYKDDLYVYSYKEYRDKYFSGKDYKTIFTRTSIKF